MYYNTWEITYSYTITYMQHWDDEIGETVYDYKNVDIVDINIYEESCGAMQAPDSYDENEWSLEYPEKLVDITVPESIEGVPVTSISDITYEVNSGGWSILTNFNIHIPESICDAGLLNYVTFKYVYLGGTDRSPELTLIYEGTCGQLFANGYSGGTFICTDGTISSDRVDYDGTCEEWNSICPDELKEIIAYCSDGIANPPLPIHKDYTFYREPGNAVYSGKLSESCTSFIIPNSMNGFPVTGVADSVAANCSELNTVVIGDNVETIGDYAFLNCQRLTKIVIPPSVVEIGKYAIGYWHNSDGTYSPMSKTVIYCVNGSAAHEYAKANGLTFELADEEEICFDMGDVNTDGTVSAADLVVLQKYIIFGSEMTADGALRADVCDDGIINIFDVCKIRDKLISAE